MNSNMPGTDAGEGNEMIPGISGSYQITETDHPELWSKRRLEIRAQDNKDTYILSGFTNQGVNISGVLRGHQLTFSRQQAEVHPEGGDGKQQWQLDMDGEARFRGTSMDFRYCIYESGEKTIRGLVKAERIP